MELTVLTENIAGSHLLAEHGLSYIIEIDEKVILFDTGHSDVFLKNAKQLGIDIENKIDTVVLSHGHWDHGDGLRFLNNKKLITHPHSFIKRYRKTDGSYIGLALSLDEVKNRFDLIETKEPIFLKENLVFLGEIPRLNVFESQTTPFIDEKQLPDFVPDDSAIAVIENNELIVISGCSHSGICNIIDYAKKVTGIETVKAVIGGFHLKFNNKQTMETIKYLQKLETSRIFPTHCTELEAIVAFHKVFPTKQVKTGMTIKL